LRRESIAGPGRLVGGGAPGSGSWQNSRIASASFIDVAPALLRPAFGGVVDDARFLVAQEVRARIVEVM